MVTEKITMAAVINTVPKNPRLCWNTLRARVALVAPEVHSPVISTLSAVIVHTIKVSTNTSKEPQSPCSTGWRVLLEAWTIGLVPQPASLE